MYGFNLRLCDTLRPTAQASQLDQLVAGPSSAAGLGSANRSRNKLRGAAHWAAKYDVVGVLGGEGDQDGYGHSARLGTYGHAGCVNALNWSSDGSLLASGSDDTRICIWKLGQEPDAVHPDNPGIVGRYPSLGLGLSSVINTGHRANIFSVKFAPLTTSILFTAAGDHETRVFDLNQGQASTQTSNPASNSSVALEWSEYSRDSGVCTRVLKCHKGRVKRIATEGDSDAVFLTCSEDGTVRQHDLRVGHECKRGHCPPPLCSYREQGMGLYSLSTSPIRPELFVVAGTSPHAFLHDRRMIPRTMKEQWGMSISPTELTQCVRRFGPAVPPLIPGPEPLLGEDDDDDDNPTDPLTRGERLRQARRRRMRARQNEDRHVTAAKLSNTNGRELLLTYSGGPVCLYDIFDDPEEETPTAPLELPKPNKAETAHVKRKAEDLESLAAGDAGQRHKSENPREQAQLLQMQRKALPSDTQSAFVAEDMDEQSGLELLQTPVSSTEEPVRQPVSSDQQASEKEQAAQQALRDSLLRSPSSEVRVSNSIAVSESDETRPSEDASQRTRRTGFEIRVGDDGELEMEIGSDSDGTPGPVPLEGANADPELNTEGYQQLLANIEAAHEGDTDSGTEEEISDEEVAAMMRGEVSTDEEDEDDDISSSDDPENYATSETRATASRDVPLVRPRKVYTGHRNVDTVKDVNFGGATDDLVVSGSDDGNVFVWSKDTSELVGIWKADSSVVNVMQYHPKLPIMAVSGIDNSVKILAPTSLEQDADDPDADAVNSANTTRQKYTARKFSRLSDKEQIATRNEDAAWTSERLTSIPSSFLINMLSRAANSSGEGNEEEDGEGGSRRRIPLSTLMQLAREGGDDGDCLIM